MVRSLMMDIQRKLVQDRSDDVESFTEMLAIYDAALFCHGRDEEEVSDHVEEHKRGKADQRDQLVRGKHHLARCSLRQCTVTHHTDIINFACMTWNFVRISTSLSALCTIYLTLALHFLQNSTPF